MERNLKNQEKIIDLKILFELEPDDYEEIIKIFKKYASSYEEAESYVARYLPAFVKDIDEKNAVLILKERLDVFKYYLISKEEISESDESKMNEFVDLIKDLFEDESVKKIARFGYKKPKERLKFLVLLHNKIENDPNLKNKEKEKILSKIKYCENYYYKALIREEKNSMVSTYSFQNDACYNFVIELVKADREKWEDMVRNFLSSQKNEVNSKNKILRIILSLEDEMRPKKRLKTYKMIDNIIKSSIIYYRDPINNNVISKEKYNKEYSRFITFFEELIKTNKEDKDRIIELFIMLSKVRHYIPLTELDVQLLKLFAHFYPDFPDKEEFIKDRVDVYLAYRKELRRKAYDKLVEENKEINDKKKLKALQIEIDDAKKMINDFINSKFYVIDEYRCFIGQRKSQIKYNLKLVEEYDEKLYSKYLKRQEKGLKILEEKTIQLLGYLKDGMVDENREFDVIDYYNIIGIDLKVLKEFVVNYKGLNSDDSYKVIRFLASSYSKENIGPNLLLNTEIEVDCKLDTEGNPIRGTGFVVPREIREDAVLYLKENNLPLTDINFTALVKRFVRENKQIKVNK